MQNNYYTADLLYDSEYIKWTTRGKYHDNYKSWYDIHTEFSVSLTTVTRNVAIFLDNYEYKWIYVEPE